MKKNKDKKAPRNYVVLALMKRSGGSGSHKKTKRKIQRELIKFLDL